MSIARYTAGFLLMFNLVLQATEQQPDILLVGDEKFSVDVGWGHPAPLEIFYYENSKDTPFMEISSANYRGHVATWEVSGKKLYLKKIDAPQYWKDKSKKVITKPQGYGVRSKSKPRADGSMVADWFSGVIYAYHPEKEDVASLYYHIRNGRVVGEGKDAEDMYMRYVAYYYNLRGDKMVIDDRASVLIASALRLSPIFGYYKNNHLAWPYNWENDKKHGAPYVTWKIIDNKFYIKQIELSYGLDLFEHKRKEIPLKEVFPQLIDNGLVRAKWINGVYAISHGKITKEKPTWSDKEIEKFNPKSVQFIRVKDGKIIESHETKIENLPPNGVGPESMAAYKLFSEYNRQIGEED